jgi:hypothetical protein
MRMNPSSDSGGKEQRLLRNARREGLLIMAAWALALVWSAAVAAVAGYDRDPADISLVLGIPDWIFWGVVFPWGLCLVFSTWFCFAWMADDDLGKDPEESAGHD